MNVAAQTEAATAVPPSEQWRLLVHNVRLARLPALLVGTVFAASYTLLAGILLTWVWWLALVAVLFVRDSLVRRVPVPATAFYAVMLVYGSLWATAPALVAWRSGADGALIALILAASVGIAAFGSYGVDARATLLVVVPIGLSVVALGIMGGSPTHYAIAVAMPSLYAHQFYVNRQAQHVLAREIRLRVENDLLVAELAQRAERTANELQKSQRTERALRISRARAERLSSIDALTKLANRRDFDRRLKAEIGRAMRERRPVSLIMCDLDYFKQYNDSYGHQQGDECLKAFARALSAFCRRGGDLAARVGGEEFALLLPHTEHVAAVLLAEQARTAFDALGLRHAGSPVGGNATASFGVATLVPTAASDGAVLLREADRALYEAKRQGRNRVVSALAHAAA